MTKTRMAAIASLVVALASVVTWILARSSPTPPLVVGSVDPETDSEDSTWCASGLVPLRGGGCFAVRPDAGRPTPLLIYLHGMYEKSTTQDELYRQKRVSERATARGFAVLALRGHLGQCARPELATWFCWPSNERNAGDGPRFVQSWDTVLREATARTGEGKRYVLGFSNGGFFAGLLAVRALFTADAFAVAGAGSVEPVRALSLMPPLVLLMADDDASRDGMVQFDQELWREHWAHETVARPGGHTLTDGDIDAALTFFVRTRTEKLPLSPPLSTYKLRPRDAEAEASSEVGNSEVQADAATEPDQATSEPE